MGKILDYLVMRTPAARLGASDQAPPAGNISPIRIVLSIVGLLLGITASFVVTGIRPATVNPPAVQATAPGPGDNAASTNATPKVEVDLSWARVRSLGLIALVICGLTYQSLYFSLRLYDQQPGFLILFVSFQYGYFWQSIVDGARTILTH
jgi:hypothetical protein